MQVQGLNLFCIHSPILTIFILCYYFNLLKYSNTTVVKPTDVISAKETHSQVVVLSFAKTKTGFPVAKRNNIQCISFCFSIRLGEKKKMSVHEV